MSYDLDEAKALLEEKLSSAERNISELEHDLSFLREQMTTLEVNIARVYNWNVKNRKST